MLNIPARFRYEKQLVKLRKLPYEHTVPQIVQGLQGLTREYKGNDVPVGIPQSQLFRILKIDEGLS